MLRRLPQIRRASGTTCMNWYRSAIMPSPWGVPKSVGQWRIRAEIWPHDPQIATDTAMAIGCLYRDRREDYRHGGRKAVRKRQQQRPPRAVDRAGHPRPRHALPDCPTLFGTLPLIRRHLNFQGRHAFVLSETVAQGQLRPLRDLRQEL